LLAFFCSPIAYVVLVVFLALNGYFFSFFNLTSGEEASLRFLFGRFMPLVLLFIMPMLTMRLMSEEFRQGTIESLMTAPVSDAAVIVGKFLGTLIFYALLLATTLVYAVVVSMFGDPDIGALLAGYIGLLLMGGLYIAVGLFFSTCTSNQIIAVLTSFSVLAVLAVLVDRFAAHVEGWLRVVLQHISVGHQFTEFVLGAIHLNNVLFFVTSTVFLLFISVKVRE
jgi:ABC-2 type transport system permease protein